jgi:hypothetical protein
MIWTLSIQETGSKQTARKNRKAISSDADRN